MVFRTDSSVSMPGFQMMWYQNGKSSMSVGIVSQARAMGQRETNIKTFQVFTIQTMQYKLKLGCQQYCDKLLEKRYINRPGTNHSQEDPCT